MTAYESLNRVRRDKVLFERLEDRVAYLEALSQRVTPILSGMPKVNSKHGQIDDTWAALADYRKQLEEAMSLYIVDCMALEKELQCIKSTRVRAAMLYRYIDLYTVTRIADKMAMNERSVYKLLKRGKTIYENHFMEANNEEKSEH